MGGYGTDWIMNEEYSSENVKDSWIDDNLRSIKMLFNITDVDEFIKTIEKLKKVERFWCEDCSIVKLLEEWNTLSITNPLSMMHFLDAYLALQNTHIETVEVINSLIVTISNATRKSGKSIGLSIKNLLNEIKEDN